MMTNIQAVPTGEAVIWKSQIYAAKSALTTPLAWMRCTARNMRRASNMPPHSTKEGEGIVPSWWPKYESKVLSCQQR